MIHRIHPSPISSIGSVIEPLPGPHHRRVKDLAASFSTRKIPALSGYHIHPSRLRKFVQLVSAGAYAKKVYRWHGAGWKYKIEGRDWLPLHSVMKHIRKNEIRASAIPEQKV